MAFDGAKWRVEKHMLFMQGARNSTINIASAALSGIRVEPNARKTLPD
ncbi:MAG: hypothetical protein OC190_16565 [Novosphingobium aromaticivorans]|nr:hypothetical protein [Novosphingobium aromaticivorans]